MEERARPVALVVPVRVAAGGSRSLCLGRRPDGVRCGVAFTSRAALARTLGEQQESLTLSLPALRRLLADVGVGCVQVDPEAAVRPSRGLPAVS